MSQDIPGLVETSSNLASIKQRDGKLVVVTSQRSSILSSRKDMSQMVSSAFLLGGAEVTTGDGYPGWKPNPSSEILQVSVESYKRLFAAEPKIKAIHAGLECGLFLEKYPSLDLLDMVYRETLASGGATAAYRLVRDEVRRTPTLLGLDKLTGNFLGVLAENRRLAELPAMIRAFAAIAAAQRGEVTAEVASAHPLSEDQVASLQEKLKAREGRTVKIRTSVDPDLLGGLVVTIGSKRIDSSIRTRLNSLAHAMKG